jgi:hypothetical protein
MSQMTAAFTTARLRAFETTVALYGNTKLHNVYIAYLLNMSTPQPVVYATVVDDRNTPDAIFPVYCQWMQVAPPFLRQGYAKEMFLAIRSWLGGTMVGDASTDEGAAFLNSLRLDPYASAAYFAKKLSPFFGVPEAQERIQREMLSLQALPQGGNPMLPPFQGDIFSVLSEVAPLAGLKWLIEAKANIPNRRELIEKLFNCATAALTKGTTSTP